jgi:hypothetical protein
MPYTPKIGKVDPTIDMNTPFRDQVKAMDIESYFNLLAQLLINNPPAKEDTEMVAKMATIGIVPGHKIDPKIAAGFKDVPQIALEKITEHGKSAGTVVNGWTFQTEMGTYGVNYIQRAYITLIGLGANRPQDAIYPTSSADVYGMPLQGSNQYVIHFDKGETPPVKGFWSLTMYNDQFFFVDNPLNRYSISARNHLQPNSDGSIDIYIQQDSPGKKKENNWLPSPEGEFKLMFRFYWPEESIINGTWKPPIVSHE